MMDFITQLDSLAQDEAASAEERLLLYSLVRITKPRVCLEIGTHRGLSTLAIAKALSDNGLGIVHTVDPKDWGAEQNYQDFQLTPYIKYHQVEALEFDLDEIDFIFFDGLHGYEAVEAEIKRFIPRLNEHGVALFHDAAGDGPTSGVNQAIVDAGLESAWLPSQNCVRIFGKLKVPTYGQHATENIERYWQ